MHNGKAHLEVDFEPFSLLVDTRIHQFKSFRNLTILRSLSIHIIVGFACLLIRNSTLPFRPPSCFVRIAAISRQKKMRQIFSGE